MKNKYYKGLGFSLTFGGENIEFPDEALDVEYQPDYPKLKKLYNKRLKVAKNPAGIKEIFITPHIGMDFARKGQDAADAMAYFFVNTPRKKKEDHLIRNILIVLLGIAVLIALWIYTEPNRVQYNKYMCATNGYYEDCKTPLKEEDRLK